MDNIINFEVNSKRWLSLEDFEGEVWKDIPNYEGCYKISNYGRIKSLHRYVTNIYGRTYQVKSKILSNWKSKLGYCRAILCKNGNEELIIVHRMVALLFLQNPNNFPIINHKDENPSNNCFWNLEWCTHKYNMNYGTAPFRKSKKMTNRKDYSLCVHQFTVDGTFIMSYPSVKEAERRTGIHANNIFSVCRGGRSSTAGGYIWSLTKNEEDVKSKVDRKEKNMKCYSEKPVVRYSIDGKYIDEFPSLAEASRRTGICKDTISRCCAHYGYYKSAGGYKWEYK